VCSFTEGKPVWSERLKVLALSVASFAIALLTAEGVLRWIGYSNPSFSIPDAQLGAALRPGAEGWWTEEGRAYVKINSDGMRDVEHAVQKPAGTLRIAILGDSYAEGRQLPIEDLFWKVLEKEVSHCDRSNGPVEVLNFGVSGYGTAQELLMLRTKVWKYKPDIVVLAFLTGNDIRNNSKKLNDNVLLPYFVLEDDRLLLDSSYLQAAAFDDEPGWMLKLGRQFVNRIRLLQLVNDIRVRWLIAPQIQVRGNGGELTAEVGLDNDVYGPPRSDAWSEAWRVTEALIQRMDADVRAANARFLLTILSNASQVDPDPAARQRFMEEFGIDDLLYPDRRILDFARQNGIDAIALAPDLQEWGQEHNTCVHGFSSSGACRGHWNRHGHRLAGAWIAKKICQSFLPVSSGPHSSRGSPARNGAQRFPQGDSKGT
jgi:hypothetical protein